MECGDIIISGGDDSTPSTPNINRHKKYSYTKSEKSCTLSRVPTLTELKHQYSTSIIRFDSLNGLSSNLNIVQHQIQSERSISDLLSNDDDQDNDDEDNENEEEDHKKLEKKLEKNWTLMLSHMSRMDSRSTIGGATSVYDLDYLNKEHITMEDLKDNNNNKDVDTSSHRSLSSKKSRRTSFFNGAAISIHSQRSILREQSLTVRLMNISTVRWLYHFGSRLSALSDQITDLILLISLLLSGADQHSSKYVCFLLAPYFVLSILLLAPLTRRSEFISSLLFKEIKNNKKNDDNGHNHNDEQLIGHKRRLRICPLLLIPIWLPLYLMILMPYLIGLDLYIYLVLTGKDLATTRYFLYYWRLKVIVEIMFEAIPQTVFILSTDLSDNVNPIIVILSLCTSIGIFLWSMLKIYRGGRTTGLGSWTYFKRYYIEQGIDMIPYLEAIVNNNLLELSLKENLQISEWKHMAKSLFFNFSIQKIKIEGQRDITPKVWSLLFYSLENNRLVSIDFTNCYLMGNKPVSSEKSQEVMELNDDDLAQIVTNTFKKKDEFNPFDKVQKNDDDDESMDVSRFTRLITLYSLQRVINVSSIILKNIQLQRNNLSCFTPYILNTISKCIYLEKLDLSSNYIGRSNEDELKNSLSNLLSGCKSLKYFILNNNGLNDQFARLFVAVLTEKNQQIQPITPKPTTPKCDNDKNPKSEKLNDNIENDGDRDDDKKNIKEAAEEIELKIDDAMDMIICNDEDQEKEEDGHLELLSLERNHLTYFGAKTLLRACNASNITINLESNDIGTDQWMTLMGTMLINVNDFDD